MLKVKSQCADDIKLLHFVQYCKFMNFAKMKNKINTCLLKDGLDQKIILLIIQKNVVDLEVGASQVSQIYTYSICLTIIPNRWFVNSNRNQSHHF